MLKRTNNLLLAAIVAINTYIVIVPFIPAATYATAIHTSEPRTLQRAISHTGDPAPGPTGPNHIIAPAMLLDQPILEGRDTYAVLNKGILHWSASSTPDKGGNTVLVGHRFTYTVPQGVFYHLDKLRVGDTIGIVWSNKQYVYRVRETKVVPPSDTSILANTPNPELTMYTCTPLWHPKDRLVVIANLEVNR